VTVEIALCLVYIGLAATLVAAMALRRVYRTSPLFFAYLCFGLCSGIAGLMIFDYSGASIWYWGCYLLQLAGDLVLYFAALTELGKNLLRANRKSAPHWNLAVVLFAVASALVSILARWTSAPGRSPLVNLCFLGMRADAALEFAGFLALISWSSLRKLRWPVRQLQIAYGFAFSTFVSFLISLLEFQWNTGPVYLRLNDIEQAAGLVTLAYWLHGFWLESDEPAGSGGASRNALAESEAGRPDSTERRETKALAGNRQKFL